MIKKSLKIGSIVAAMALAAQAEVLTLQSGWNLVSVPGYNPVSPACITSQLPAGSAIYTYDSAAKKWVVYSDDQAFLDQAQQAGWPKITTLRPSVGYWVKNSGAATVTVTVPCTTDPVMTVPSTGLTKEAAGALAHMWNEEKLAKDIYLAMYDLTGNQTFYNIASQSETQHQESVQNLIAAYDLNILDPDYGTGYSADALAAYGPGQYSIDAIKDLYDALYAKGSQSEVDALQVGCMVEVTDINDLDDELAKVQDYSNITTTFEFLRDGSYNHYWAFDRALKAIGVNDGCCSLGAEYCKTPEEYPSQNGGGNGQGNGHGHGRN
jgi:hypothetical protein